MIRVDYHHAYHAHVIVSMADTTDEVNLREPERMTTRIHIGIRVPYLIQDFGPLVKQLHEAQFPWP